MCRDMIKLLDNITVTFILTIHLQQFRYLCKRLKKKTKTKKTDQEKKAEKESEIVNPFSWTT